MKQFVAIFEQAEDGGWGAYVPDLPGCTSWGTTRAAAARNVKDAIEAYLQALRELGQPIPQPGSFTELISVS